MAERWKPSVTVAAVVERLIDGENRYLLVEERTRDGLRLNNPAGHLDAGESLEQAVAREVLEETTCRFSAHGLVGVYLWRSLRSGGDASPDITYLRFAFCGTVSKPDHARALDTGIVRTLWMTIDEVHASRAQHRSPLVQRCIDDYRAGVRYPLQLLHAYPAPGDPAPG